MKRRTLILKFSDVPPDVFSICIEEVYKRISKVVIEILLTFCIAYLCEQSFSSFLLIINAYKALLMENSSCSLKY